MFFPSIEIRGQQKSIVSRDKLRCQGPSFVEDAKIKEERKKSDKGL